MAPKHPDNMRIWNVLGKTDPSATKPFTRSGGFRGTAVKPMWSNMRMTQEFGPCGIGWGQNEPTFQTVNCDGEILVYCTVGMWYFTDGSRATVYGVGGDKVVAKGKDGLRTDDEAFKKAYTDALSNAMKFIGVAADVHMGLFDDNKYVQDVRNEFEEEKKKEVFAEVEKQKAAARVVVTNGAVNEIGVGPSNVVLPPELEWSYNKSSGVLICKPANVKKAKNAKGREFVVVTLNNYIGERSEAFYFHKSHTDELLGCAGKVCKFLVVESKGFVNIDEVLEIDGVQVRTMMSNTVEETETQCRLLASVVGLEEEELRELYSTVCQGSWTITLDALKQRKSELDEGVEAGAR